ncbi:hypothetical protein FRB98_000978 [Tulasnella sp. 332]|nr:hypothetical protein FRB98_000978 [Tulasnella sp. 332]
MGSYGMMKMFEICVMGFWNREEDWPKWVKLQTDQERKEGKRREIISFTPTVLGRLAYSLDLATAGGSSWYRGRAWDWAAPAILNQHAQSLPRFQFFLQSLVFLIRAFLLVDVCESILASRTWDTTRPQPLTGDGIPMLMQLVFATCVCARTMVGTSFTYTFFGMMFGLVMNTPSTAFPPMFNRPFASRSLAEFWSSKWHPIYRRPFHQLSSGIISLFIFFSSSSSQKTRILARRDVKIFRSIIVFTLSCLLHLLHLKALPTDAIHPYPSFFNTAGMKFFLSQPLGIAIEVLFVRPFTESLPDRVKSAVRRGFAWAWLLWSGRFFADIWFARGLLDHTERDIIYSPVRGILKGQWRID